MSKVLEEISNIVHEPNPKKLFTDLSIISLVRINLLVKCKPAVWTSEV
jgi:hypothetical protein